MFYSNFKYIGFITSNRRGALFLLLSLFYAFNAIAQQDNLEEKKYSIEYQVFVNANFNDESSQDLKFDYDIKRTLIVYQQYLTENWSFCLAGDTYLKIDNEIYNRTPYVKRAYVQYHNQDLSISAGLFVSEQFKFQRKTWQLRYVSTMLQKKFNYGENRNIGILLKHNLTNRFSYDVAITSGYYTPIKKSSKKYQLMTGQTFKADFCTLRLFNSIAVNSNYEHVLSFFATKEIGNGKFGVDLAMKNSNNIQQDEDQYGFSFFGNQSFHKNWMCFARYDMNKKSVDSQSQNIIWAGMQYSFKKHLKASMYYKNKDFDTNYYGLAIFIH